MNSEPVVKTGGNHNGSLPEYINKNPHQQGKDFFIASGENAWLKVCT